MRLENQIGADEHVLWSGTKDRKVSLWESVFNSMLPLALLWGCIDFSIIRGAVSAFRDADVSRMSLGFMVPFFLIHLMPVWMYLGGVISSVFRAKNTRYCITDKAVYVQSGVFETKIRRKEYPHFISLEVGQSFWDKRAGTGDVVIMLDEVYYTRKSHRRRNRTLSLANIPDYEAVFQLVQQYQNIYKYNEVARSLNGGIPPFGNPPVPPFGYPQQPQYANPQVPQYGNPQQPQYANPQAQQYGNQQVPQYGNPQALQYGNPQAPQYGNPQAQQYGNPQVQQYGNPQVQPLPQPAVPEMAELVTPPAQDEFVDPTLAAFEFQKDDAFGGDDGSGSGF